MTWVIVGREHSGDEDENVSPVAAFAPFPTLGDAELWLETTPMFDGKAIQFTPDVAWLLDLLDVPVSDPDVDGEGPK